MSPANVGRLSYLPAPGSDKLDEEPDALDEIAEQHLEEVAVDGATLRVTVVEPRWLDHLSLGQRWDCVFVGG